MTTLDIILGIISCILTIMVLSYLVGDNPMFRIAIFIFVGVSAGYVGAVALYQVHHPESYTAAGQRPGGEPARVDHSHSPERAAVGKDFPADQLAGQRVHGFHGRGQRCSRHSGRPDRHACSAIHCIHRAL